MEYLTVVEVSEFLGVSPRYVRTLLAQGRIHGFKDSRAIWRISIPFGISRGKRGPALKAYSKGIGYAVTTGSFKVTL